MVVEFRVTGGTWEAFSSERVPRRSTMPSRTAAKFYDAAQYLTADDLLDNVSMFLPMTHNTPNCDLIAKCPVDEWIDKGELFSSAKSRRRLAIEVTQK